MNIQFFLFILFFALFVCGLYELLIIRIIKSWRLSGIEKEIYDQFDQFNKFEEIVNNKSGKKEILDLINTYKLTPFKNNEIDLKIEIAKLIFHYIVTVYLILIQNDIQSRSFSSEDSTDTIPKLIKLEKEKKELEISLKNLLSYIKNKEK